MAFKIPTISYIISKMTDDERTFLTNILDTTQVTEWQQIDRLPQTREICLAVMQIPHQRSCAGILWNNAHDDYYLIDIFTSYQTAIYHIKNNVITPVAEYCTTLEVRYWLTKQETEPADADPYLTKLKEIMAINDLDIEFGRNVEVDGSLKVNKDITINGGTALHTGNTKTIFGNKSLIKTYNDKGEVADGNIDLYEHLIKVMNGDTMICNFIVISSSNVKVDSPLDLRTIMGQDEFYLPIGTKDFIESTATTMYVTINGAKSTILDKTFKDEVTTA